MDLYFITKIENFNKIFSLQFILPTKNYKEIYNYKESRFDINYEYITLYRSIPDIEKDEFIIQIKFKDTMNLIKVNEDIFLYPKNIITIGGKIIFFNEETKKIMSARTMLTAEVKNMKEYIKNSDVLREEDTRFIDHNNYKVENSIKNNLLEDELLKVNLYDCILGGIYYSVFKNRSSILSNKKIKEEYIKNILLEKYIKNLKENNCYYSNVKKGFEKEQRMVFNNIKRQLEINGNEFFKIDLYGNYYVKSNASFKYVNNEVVVFNIILNNLCRIYDVKLAMIKIGEEIKIKIPENEYLENYRKIYDIFINGKETYNIKDIKSEVLKSFIIALFKYERLKEIREMSEEYNLNNSIYPYFFAGILQKYSNISKIIIDEIERDSICKFIINNEIINIFRIMEIKNKKEVYKEIQKFQLETNMYKLRRLNMKNEFENVKIYSISRKIINISLYSESSAYIISFNENENEKFNGILNNIELKKKNRARYKSFKIRKKDNEKLNAIDERNILNLIKKKIY